MTPHAPHPSPLNRPLGEHHRQLAFALTASLLLAASVGLSWIEQPAGDTAPQSARTTPTTALAQTVAAEPPSRPLRRPDRRLRRTAVRFLHGYLPHLYGQAPLGRVEAVSRGLRRRLARERLRVPPAARRRRPRLRGLRLGARVRDARAWRATARIADGDVAVYPIELLIGSRNGRLVVVGTGGE